MADKYDPSVPYQHAQLLFDHWTHSDLEDLYAWLSRRNFDANVLSHKTIEELYLAEHRDEVSV